MRKLWQRICIVVTMLLFGLLSCPAFAAQGTLNIYFDGTSVEQHATTVENLVFFSARDLADLFGDSLEYDATKKVLTINHEKTTAVLTIGSSTIQVNGKNASLDASPMITDGSVMIPSKALSVIWNASIGWNEQAVYINSDGSEVLVPEIPKVFPNKQTVSIDDKKINVSTIFIPYTSHLNADIAIAKNEIGETESLLDLSKRTSAKAAINGSYFQSYDTTKSMDPYGLLIKNGKLIHAEQTGSTVGFTANGQMKIGVIRAHIVATVGDATVRMQMMNHTPMKDSDQVVLFTDAYGKQLGFSYGTNVVIQNGEIIQIVQNQNVTIPENGYVLNFNGKSIAQVKTMQKGDACSYQVSYTSSFGASDWTNVRTAVGAGPILVMDGAISVNPEKEGFTDSTGFTIATSRSAVCTTSEGILLISGVKCTLDQLASICQQLGATSAIALDAGAASGSYAQNAYVTTPGKEISNALIFK